MKVLFMLMIIGVAQLFSSFFPEISVHDFVDPTGTYVLKGTVKNNRIQGHSGEIRVKLLNRNSIALCFTINSGYPAYESGAFVDTLTYQDNQANYKPVQDRTCSILFSFTNYSVETQQLLSDPRSSCSFGKGVMVSAIFNKYSEDIPIIQNLSPLGTTAP